MKDPLFNKLSGLASIGIVLATVLLASGGLDSPQGKASERGLVEALEAAGLEAAEASPTPQHKRPRVRASLGMPYFSFAQSLRPRG